MTTEEHTSGAARSQTVVTLLWFLGLSTVFAAGAYYFIIEHGLRRYYVSMLMWTPAIAVLVTCKVRSVDLAELGWHWPKGRWIAAAYLLPVLYGAAAYAIIWGGGFGGLIDPKFVKEVSYFLGLADWSEGTTIAFGILMFGSVGMIWHSATALGEEIGWRGFLTPTLMKLTSFPLASLCVGLVWALWHMPIIFWTKYNAGPTDIELQFFNYCLMTIGMSFILTYLRVRSGSLWPAVILHASHNIYVLTIMQPMTVQYKETWRYASEFGFILPLVTLAVGLYFWRRFEREEKASA
jgi:membrane protease YdiL (CAAX protease family)